MLLNNEKCFDVNQPALAHNQYSFKEYDPFLIEDKSNRLESWNPEIEGDDLMSYSSRAESHKHLITAIIPVCDIGACPIQGTTNNHIEDDFACSWSIFMENSMPADSELQKECHKTESSGSLPVQMLAINKYIPE